MAFEQNGTEKKGGTINLSEEMVPGPLALIAYAIAVPVLVVAFKQIKADLSTLTVSRWLKMTALVYAIQIFSLPVTGTPAMAHLTGATLLAATIGPWPGVVVMSIVCFWQMVFDPNQGLAVLGVNIFNKAVVGVMAGGFIYRSIIRTPGRERVALFVASFLSVLLVACCTATEVVWSVRPEDGLEVISPRHIYRTMLAWHMLVGILEGLAAIGVAPIIHKSL